MDKQFTHDLQTWLELPPETRDYDKGNLLLLQLSHNQVRYRNYALNARAKAAFIEYELRRYLKFRLADLTHQEVSEMQRRVETMPALNDHAEENRAFRAGKRADHDLLPEHIRALYTENLDLLRRMREVHLRLRNLSLADAPCPDSERYPFLKELIDLDTRRHANWETYDRYRLGADPAAPAQTPKAGSPGSTRPARS